MNADKNENTSENDCKTVLNEKALQEVVGGASGSSGGSDAVSRAEAWVGRAEYVWGACSPGAFDCSGFVSYCLTGSYTRNYIYFFILAASEQSTTRRRLRQFRSLRDILWRWSDDSRRLRRSRSNYRPCSGRDDLCEIALLKAACPFA